MQVEERCKIVSRANNELQSLVDEQKDEFDDIIKKYTALVQKVSLLIGCTLLLKYFSDVIIYPGVSEILENFNISHTELMTLITGVHLLNWILLKKTLLIECSIKTPRFNSINVLLLCYLFFYHLNIVHLSDDNKAFTYLLTYTLEKLFQPVTWASYFLRVTSFNYK